MAFELCLDACCEPPPPACDICNEPGVTFDLTVSGIADGTPIPNPPTIGDCVACDDLNQTMPLTYVGYQEPPAGLCLDGTPVDNMGCLFAGGLDTCTYYYDPPNVAPYFSRLVAAYFFLYRTTGGDIRGSINYYLQETYDTGSIIGFNSRQVYYDELIASGVDHVDCATIDIAAMFADCGIQTVLAGCNAPTGFTLVGVAA